MTRKIIDQVAESLIGSYSDSEHAAAHTDCPFPDRRVIARIRRDLLSLLLPGYFGVGPNSSGFAAFLHRTLSGLRRDLTTQAHRAARCVDRDNKNGFPTTRVDEFLRSLGAVRGVLARDIEALFEADPAAPDRLDVAGIYPGIEAIATFRAAHELLQLGFPRLPRMLTELAHAKTGIDIHPGAAIGPGFAVDHGTGVVIGETTIIGSNVRIYQGVTLGSLTFARNDDGNLIRGPRPKRHPTLCDHVIVYANASVLGGNTVVGAYTRIGANVRLTESVGSKMDVLVEGSNFRIRPRRVLVADGDQAYEDRTALSRLAGEGGPGCGDVDELEWPRRS